MAITPTLWKSQSTVASGAGAQSTGQIVALANGGYVVVYLDGSDIKAWSYDALGTKVTGPITVATGADTAAVTDLGNGTFAVAYARLDGADYDIHVRRFSADMAFLGQTDIDTGTSETVNPSITSLGGGSYAVAYTIGSGADTDIVARIVDAGGTVGAQFDIHNQTDNSSSVQLATLSGGSSFVAVFQDEESGSTTDTDVLFHIFTSSGSALTGSIVIDDNSHIDSEPDVAALSGGGFCRGLDQCGRRQRRAGH